MGVPIRGLMLDRDGVVQERFAVVYNSTHSAQVPAHREACYVYPSDNTSSFLSSTQPAL